MSSGYHQHPRRDDPPSCRRNDPGQPRTANQPADPMDRRQDPVHRRVRCVPVGDDRIRRSDPARYDLPRTPRRHVLDRPISEFDGLVDSVRVPVVPPTGECRPFQEVLVELGGRLKLPAFTTRRHTQISRLSGLHRESSDRTGFGRGLSDRLVRQGRQGCAGRRAESESV